MILGRQALFIVLTDHPGGAEQIACILANALARRLGWSVQYRVLCAKAEPSFSESRLSAAVDLQFGSTASPLIGLILLPPVLGSRRFDLVFTTHIYTSASSALARQLGLLGVKRLVARESTTIFDRFRGVKRWLAKVLYWTYGAQDMVVCQTAYMRSHIAKRVSERARMRLAVLGNPLDLNALNHSAGLGTTAALLDQLAGRLNVLVCGSLIEVKQPLLAIETFALLCERVECDLQLVFMGDGPLRAAAEAEVAARGLADRVVFLGRQTNPYSIMQACQYGLLTSSREGFPNVVLEMMACGVRKVVMTPCAGDLDVLTGVTVTRGFEAGELASALGDAIIAGVDMRQTYRAVVTPRSVEHYLDAVLGVEVEAR